MTLYHFGNCVALIYVPYYLTYKYSGLSEYGAFWKCFQAGCVYMFTQLAKMLVLATFFPDTETFEGTSILGEFLKATVDLADLVGLYVVLAGIPGKGHSKVLTAGIGWATAEVILSRALLLWVGARGAEFDWRYIQKCFESNVSLIQYITTVTLIWLWSRHDLNKHFKPMVTVLLLLCSYKPMMMELVIQVLGCGAWMALLLKAVITLGLGAMTLQIYAGLAQTIGICGWVLTSAITLKLRTGYTLFLHAKGKAFINGKTKKKKRLAWAKERLHWTEEDWNRIIFSDESKFEVSVGDSRSRVIRLKSEAFHPDCLKRTVKFAKRCNGVGMYVCMSSNGLGTLEFIDGNVVNAEKYQKILSENLLPSIETLYPDGNFIFQPE